MGSWLIVAACSAQDLALPDDPGGGSMARAGDGSGAASGATSAGGVAPTSGRAGAAQSSGGVGGVGGRGGGGSSGNRFVPDASAQEAGRGGDTACECPPLPPPPESVSIPCSTTTPNASPALWATLPRSEDVYDLDRTLAFVQRNEPPVGEVAAPIVRAAGVVYVQCGSTDAPGIAPNVRFVLYPR